MDEIILIFVWYTFHHRSGYHFPNTTVLSSMSSNLSGKLIIIVFMFLEIYVLHWTGNPILILRKNEFFGCRIKKNPCSFSADSLKRMAAIITITCENFLLERFCIRKLCSFKVVAKNAGNGD